MIIVPKTAGEGLQVDGPGTPSYPWKDKEGFAIFNTGGAGAPTISAYRGGNCRGLSFALNDKLDYHIHMPHDWAPGTDLYAHVHWSHNGTAITGNASFQLDYTYAKGHNQADFAAEKQQTITYATTNIGTTPQWRHRIDEVQLSDATGSGNYLNRGNLEPDGMILIAVKLTALPTITGGNLFIHMLDLHYQSTGVGTKQKAPNFYT